MTLLKAMVIESARTEQELFDATVCGLVPSRADWASIHVANPEGDLQLRSVTHADPYKVNLAWELDRRWPARRHSQSGAAAVCRTGAAEVGGVPDELLATTARDGDHLQVLRALGLRSYCCVAMRADGEIVGALTLVSAESGRSFGQRDLPAIQTTADAVAARAAHLRREGLAQVGMS